MNRTRIKLAWKMWEVSAVIRKVADGIKAHEQDIVLATLSRLPTLGNVLGFIANTVSSLAFDVDSPCPKCQCSPECMCERS